MSANALTFFLDRFTVERYIGRLAGRVAFSRTDDRLSPIFLSRFFFVPFLSRRFNQTYSTRLLVPLLIVRSIDRAKERIGGKFRFAETYCAKERKIRNSDRNRSSFPFISYPNWRNSSLRGEKITGRKRGLF